jgi:hypothetical protein
VCASLLSLVGFFMLCWLGAQSSQQQQSGTCVPSIISNSAGAPVYKALWAWAACVSPMPAMQGQLAVHMHASAPCMSHHIGAGQVRLEKAKESTS